MNLEHMSKLVGVSLSSYYCMLMTVLLIGNIVPKLQSGKARELFHYDGIKGSNIDTWSKSIRSKF